jgi:hypothetical protein
MSQKKNIMIKKMAIAPNAIISILFLRFILASSSLPLSENICAALLKSDDALSISSSLFVFWSILLILPLITLVVSEIDCFALYTFSSACP